MIRFIVNKSTHKFLAIEVSSEQSGPVTSKKTNISDLKADCGIHSLMGVFALFAVRARGGFISSALMSACDAESTSVIIKQVVNSAERACKPPGRHWLRRVFEGTIYEAGARSSPPWVFETKARGERASLEFTIHPSEVEFLYGTGEWLSDRDLRFLLKENFDHEEPEPALHAPSGTCVASKPGDSALLYKPQALVPNVMTGHLASKRLVGYFDPADGLATIDADLPHAKGAEYKRLIHDRARLKTIIGQVADARSDLESLLADADVSSSRLYLLGQLLNVEFIRLDSSALTHLVSGGRMRDRGEVVDAAREMSELMASIYGVNLEKVAFHSRVPTLRTTSRFDTYAAHYALLQSAVEQVENMAAGQVVTRTLLEWQLTIVERLVRIQPEVGWNRFTPLIAQCLRKGFHDFAQGVWYRAASFELTGTPRRLGQYIQFLKQGNGVEWRLHKGMGVQIAMLRGDFATARSILDSLGANREQYAIGRSREPFFECWFGSLLGSLKVISQRKSAIVGVDVLKETCSHAAYLPTLI